MDMKPDIIKLIINTNLDAVIQVIFSLAKVKELNGWRYYCYGEESPLEASSKIILGVEKPPLTDCIGVILLQELTPTTTVLRIPDPEQWQSDFERSVCQIVDETYLTRFLDNLAKNMVRSGFLRESEATGLDIKLPRKERSS
jgi:hypothetical protein